MINEELQAQIALTYIPKLGPITIRHLISYCGSAIHVFKVPKNKLLKIPGVGLKLASLIQKKEFFDKAEEEILHATKNRIQILAYTDPKYPNRLKNLPDAPIIIYYKGNADLNHTKIISIVGTRNATDYGNYFIENLTKELTRLNVLIVSGLAYGIDIKAHKEALKNNIPTIGVMASGLNIIYPSVHKITSEEMINHGGLLSEYGYDVKPESHYFPERNRIIAGLSDATIIVEAANKGGALITAEFANNYNKDVFAVPGRVDQKYSEGCNTLIKRHKAHILTSYKDLEYIMDWAFEGVVDKKTPNDLDAEESNLVNLLIDHKQEMAIDDINNMYSENPSTIASLLLTLELKGIVKALPGKRYKLANEYC